MVTNDVDVVFVPDEDTNIVDCFDCPILEKEKHKKETTKSLSSTPVRKVHTTKSGRKVVPKFSIKKSKKVSSSSEDESTEEIVKPTALYEDDEEVAKMFDFRTPSKKGMVMKAHESIKALQTPHATHSKIKKKIEKEACRQKLEELLEDCDSDEYLPASESSEESESDEEQFVIIERKPSVSHRMSTRSLGDIGSNFMFTSDDYFHRQSNNVTSSHTFTNLKTPKLRLDQLSSLLESVKIEHKKPLLELAHDNRLVFKRWLTALSEGFNILAYGVGSKKDLLNDFAAKYLADSNLIVVNGFFPGVSHKEILDAILDLLNIKNGGSQPQEIIEVIANKLKSQYVQHLFIIINNIDGSSLRSDKTQNVLANLSALPKIHIIASVDHLNCPLLWDQSKLSKFNFIWEDGTTFAAYTEETSFESSMMVQKSGVAAFSALKNVFKSLTHNTKRIFKIILKYQLENQGKQYQGILFSELYRKCRDSFIASSDLALRTQLTEFIDHQLVKWKKDTDHLIIPIDNQVLKKFVDEIDE